MKPLSRLCGLETEYAMHFDASKRRDGKMVTHLDHYEELRGKLSRQSATAPAGYDKVGTFFANGSAIWFENVVGNQGLAEICTPECDSPKQLLAASDGMDQLLVESTKQAQELLLHKNCVCPKSKLVYGAQENYEVASFDDADQRYWKHGITLLRAFNPVSFVFLIVLISTSLLSSVFTSAPFFIIAAIYFLARYHTSCGRLKLLGGLIFHDFIAAILIPKTIAVSLFYRWSKVGKTYRKLAPFLASRVIFAGAGGLDQKGRFYLGQKAHQCNTDWFMVMLGAQKSIFCLNTVFKGLDREALGASKGMSSNLDSRRHRLSIAIGDSNMCQEATYLRVATTSLVLDAIEAGAIAEIPELRTVRALKTFNNDPQLQAEVNTSRGRMSAIEIQQFYLNACRRYVESLPDAPDETFEVLSLWSEVLFQLKSDPDMLFGRIDWITKRKTFRQIVAASDNGETIGDTLGGRDEFKEFGNRPALKKADIKYHEMSSDGYYFQLLEQGHIRRLIGEEAVEIAQRMPPLSPSAAQRCRYIREFGDQLEWVVWDQAKIRGQSSPIKFKTEA